MKKIQMANFSGGGKLMKRIVSILLSVILITSTVIISGVTPVSAESETAVESYTVNSFDNDSFVYENVGTVVPTYSGSEMEAAGITRPGIYTKMGIKTANLPIYYNADNVIIDKITTIAAKTTNTEWVTVSKTFTTGKANTVKPLMIYMSATSNTWNSGTVSAWVDDITISKVADDVTTVVTSNTYDDENIEYVQHGEYGVTTNYRATDVVSAGIDNYYTTVYTTRNVYDSETNELLIEDERLTYNNVQIEPFKDSDGNTTDAGNAAHLGGAWNCTCYRKTHWADARTNTIMLYDSEADNKALFIPEAETTYTISLKYRIDTPTDKKLSFRLLYANAPEQITFNNTQIEQYTDENGNVTSAGYALHFGAGQNGRHYTTSYYSSTKMNTLLIYDSTENAGDSYTPHTKLFTPLANTEYTLSFKYRVDAVPTMKMSFKLLYVNDGTGMINQYKAANVILDSIVEIPKATTDGWVEAKATFTTGDTVKPIMLQLGSNENWWATNVDIWVDDIVITVPTASEENCADFENYKEEVEGISIDSSVAEITYEEAYGGIASLKAVLPENGITAFEIRGSQAFEVIKGNTYEVSFAYKTSADTTISAGLAKATDVTKAAYAIADFNVTASDEWQTATLTMTADKGTADDYAFAMLLYAKSGAIVYIDNITVKDITESESTEMVNMKAIPDGTDLTDYYIYLPEGSVIDGDYGMTFYDTFFNSLSDAFVGNTMFKGAYVMFSTAPDESKITIPADLEYLVHSGTKEELYCGLESQIVTEKLSEVGEKAVNYIFITDLHFSNNSSAAETAVANQVKAIAQTANENDLIDFVVIAGDIVQEGADDGKATHIEKIQTILAPLKDCSKPVFILPGNHDDNARYMKDLTEEEALARLISNKDWNDNVIDVFCNNNGYTVTQDSKDSNSKYYYYDLSDKKTRVICLDAIDRNSQYDPETGMITSLYVNNGEEDMYMVDWYGYGARQLKWLTDEALTAGDGWDYVFVSHMGIDYNTNLYNDPVEYGDELRQIMLAFQNKTYYVNEALDIDVDFTEDTGKIITYQFGHTHLELELYSEDIDLWQISSSTSNLNQNRESILSSLTNPNYEWNLLERTLSTETEANFDVVSASRDRVYKLNVGAGDTVKMIYSNESVSGDVNMDSVTNLKDLVLLKKISASIERMATSADVDKNNKLEAVDLTELRKILLK